MPPERNFGKANRKVYTSWCLSPGETHLAGETMNPYCVILCPEPLVNPVSYPRTKCFFLRAPSADGAIQAALADNPQWRVIGIEPKDLFAYIADSSDVDQGNGVKAIRVPAIPIKVGAQRRWRD
jgi:hypothetical protein